MTSGHEGAHPCRGRADPLAVRAARPAFLPHQEVPRDSSPARQTCRRDRHPRSGRCTGSIVTASTAQAANTGSDTISCKAVKAHKSYSTGSATVGVAYKGDKITSKQWVYQRSAKTWWVNGTVTRMPDHKKIRGYVVYQCANPYNT
ncbi:hypothetical protein [Streptomyces sp. NPDC002215]|uniref:hypothetical protein n=1 Tax=Streptomyces sp. NPDC002215 TaxID=3154412 RepID=UPI003322A235